MSEKKWRKVRNLDRSGRIDPDELRSTVRTYHVIPGDSDKWAVRNSGAHRGSRTFSTQSEATEHAKKLARQKGAGNIVIHNRDGRIVRKSSYRRDPTHGRDPDPFE